MNTEVNHTAGYNLIVVPFSISKMVSDGIFTLDDLIYNEDTLKHLSDLQIISFMNLNNATSYCNLSHCGIFQVHKASERVNRLSRLCSVEETLPKKKVEKYDSVASQYAQYNEDHFKLQSATRKTFAIMVGWSYDTVAYSVPHMVARMLSGRYGYKTMVNTNAGALYQAMAH